MRARTVLTAFLLTGTVLLAGAAATTPSAFLVDLATATEGGLSFTMPAEAALIGYATDEGGFRLAVAPLGSPNAAATGLEPTYECTNDRRVAPHGVDAPLTASLTGAAVPNFASAGACTGAQGLMGPVASMEFSTSGDRGGGIVLSAPYAGDFQVFCHPAMTFAGAGVGEAWATTLLYEETYCNLDWNGVPPSQYWDWSGYVWNSNQAFGTTRGLVTVS